MRVSTLLVLSATQSVVGMTMNLSPKSNSVLSKSAKSQKKNSGDGDSKNSFAKGVLVGLRAAKAGLAVLPTGCSMMSGPNECSGEDYSPVDVCPATPCACTTAAGATVPGDDGGMGTACATGADCAGTSEAATSLNPDSGTISCVAPGTTAGSATTTATTTVMPDAAAAVSTNTTTEDAGAVADATAEGTAAPSF